MKRYHAAVIYLIQFVLYFVLFALFLTSFPSTPKWAEGVTRMQKFWILFQSNSPMWIMLSAIFAGIGTGLFVLLRQVIYYKK